MTATRNIVELKPKITVIGVGGGGGNAVNNMIAEGLQGADFVFANTDAQALVQSNASPHYPARRERDRRLGTGSRPDVGVQRLRKRSMKSWTILPGQICVS
jgi:cell division protein FtsZ